jgi:hypothetical protein
MRFRMIRSLVLASILGSTLLGCARAPVRASAASPKPPEPAVVAVTYRLLRIGDGDGVLLSGRTLIDPHYGARVESSAAHTSAGQQLDFEARPREDGSVLVEVRYEESSADGARFQWRPAVRISHGATARAEVNGSGWGRVLEVSVE